MHACLRLSLYQIYQTKNKFPRAFFSVSFFLFMKGVGALSKRIKANKINNIYSLHIGIRKRF
jgi:hypothetical protein